MTRQYVTGVASGDDQRRRQIRTCAPKELCGLAAALATALEPWRRHIAVAIAAFAFLSVSATRTARMNDARECAEAPADIPP